MNTKVIVGIVVVVVIVAVAFFLMQPSEPSREPTPTPAVKYSLSEVAQHDSADDCWVIMEGVVYDVTDYIASHPGGESIVEGCGIDGTFIYDNRPMGSGSPHSDNARALREQYKIGELE